VSSTAAPRKVGAYAKLLANYAADDAVISAGEAAELLFVRGLAFCATSDADGYITENQVIRYLGAGMKGATRRAERLVEVGLWAAVDGGYQVRSWTKLHDTAEQKGRARAEDADRKREARKRGAPAVGAGDEVQPDASMTPGGLHPDGTPDSLSLNTTRQDMADTGHLQHLRAADAASSETTIPKKVRDASFDAFWQAYPKKTAKEQARRRFEILLARKVDPAELIAGAKAFAKERRGEDPRFTPFPATWLNQGRWQDEAPAPAAVESARRTFFDPHNPSRNGE
jgi:hypothetical protein